jgi:predicted DNA-binding protein (MmcQ/YjbR family)
MASKRKQSGSDLVDHLRQLGLRKYPGAHLKSPWPGHLDLAVQDKTFAYLSAPGDPAGISLKLPLSCSIALQLPGAEPTGYGLGKSGWVSLMLDGRELPPVEQLEEWLDESYRAQAPKKLLAQLDGVPAAAKAAKAKSRPANAAPKRKARGARTPRARHSM